MTHNVTSLIKQYSFWFIFHLFASIIFNIFS